MMSRNSRSDSEALAILARLFPGGLRDPDLLAEACPEGWQASPLRLAFHPTAEQRYREHLGWLKSPMNELLQREEKSPPQPPLSFEEFRALEEPQSRPALSEDEEWPELLGSCLWVIFSDNHELVDESGSRFNFGSFRAVSSLIDEFMEGKPLSEAWGRGDYMRFYLGASFASERTDLRPVYRLIFSRLKNQGYEWCHVFPRIYRVRLHAADKEPNSYNPSEAFAQEKSRKEEDEEEEKQQEEMARDLARAKQDALDQAPPATVLAYQEIYGKDPHGWPPDPTSPE